MLEWPIIAYPYSYQISQNYQVKCMKEEYLILNNKNLV